MYWESFFVNMLMFCGYAALFVLQHEIKSKFGISDSDIIRSRQFGVAVSFLDIFNLIFRFWHNLIFGFVGPRGRTFVSTMAMMSSMLIIAVRICILDSYYMGLVVLSYALGGVAIVSFEANFLCCLTHLGHATKHVAITAIPVGITGVLVGGFFAMGPPLNVPAVGIYLVVAFSFFCGMVLFATRIPLSRPSLQGLRCTFGIRRLSPSCQARVANAQILCRLQCLQHVRKTFRPHPQLSFEAGAPGHLYNSEHHWGDVFAAEDPTLGAIEYIHFHARGWAHLRFDYTPH